MWLADQLLKTGPAVNHGLAQIFGAACPSSRKCSLPRFLISKLRQRTLCAWRRCIASPQDTPAPKISVRG